MYEKAIVILGVFLTCAAGLHAADIILNEYNAVGNNSWLDCDGEHCPTCGGPPCKEDIFCFGRIEGNGGNWFELVVTRDHPDIRGWQLEWTEGPAEDPADAGTLTLTQDPLWADLQAGTIITFIEFDTVLGGLDTDDSYDPHAGDWWININTLAWDGPQEQYVTTTTSVGADPPGSFSVSRRNWQLTIKDADSNVVFGPCGEGAPGETADVTNEEVFKLEEDPGPDIHPVDSTYRSGTSSTFGHPNVWSGGDNQQDFAFLRCDDGKYCNGSETSDASDVCQTGAEPCPDQMCDDDNDVCADCLSDGDCDNRLYCDGPETCDVGGNCQRGANTCVGQMCRESDDACVDCLTDGDCDDTRYCNGAETCDVSGDCQPGTDPCAGRLCDPDAEECYDQGCSSDGDCDDALYCNGLETCVDASCQAGTHVDCDDGLNCTDDSCDEDTDSCDNTPGNANCDNGLFCDGAEICDPLLGCQPGSDPCPDQTCDEQADLCADCLSSADCDDGEFCNGDETCQAGVCTDGEHPCADLDNCDEVNDECVPCLDDAECDDDGDGVVNSLDECADTPAGAKVDDTGCTITLPEEPAGAELPTSGNGDDGNIEAPPSSGQDVGGSASGSDNGDDGNTDASPDSGGHAGGSASGGGSGSCGIIGLVNLAFIFMGLVAVRFARRSRA